MAAVQDRVHTWRRLCVPAGATVLADWQHLTCRRVEDSFTLERSFNFQGQLFTIEYAFFGSQLGFDLLVVALRNSHASQPELRGEIAVEEKVT